MSLIHVLIAVVVLLACAAVILWAYECARPQGRCASGAFAVGRARTIMQGGRPGSASAGVRLQWYRLVAMSEAGVFDSSSRHGGIICHSDDGAMVSAPGMVSIVTARSPWNAFPTYNGLVSWVDPVLPRRRDRDW